MVEQVFVMPISKTVLPSNAPKNLVAHPVQGQVRGAYQIDSGDLVLFDIRTLIYGDSHTPPYTYLYGESKDPSFKLTFSGPIKLEHDSRYAISEEPSELEVLFIIEGSHYVGYDPAQGSLFARHVYPEDEYERIEGQAAFVLNAEDANGVVHRIAVQVDRIDIYSKPLPT